jgi:foldase protein PrsA
VRAVRTVALTFVLALAPAVPASAQDDPIFTVTAPSGVYTASQAEFDHWLDVSRRASGGPGARAQVFQLLTSLVWVEGEAAEQGIVVTADEARDSLDDQVRQTFPNRRAFRRWLRRQHQTYADVLRRVRSDMLSTEIRRRVIAPVTVTDADIDRYLDRRDGNIRIPERRDLRIVLTRTRAAGLAARRELLAGAKWSAVTRRYSIDEASMQDGGRLPGQAKGTLERRLDRAVFRARTRRVVGPVRTQFGYYVFWVSRIHPAREHSRGWSRRYVRPVVLGQAQERALDRWVAEFQDRWRSRTICAPRYAKYEQCAPTG